MDMCRIVRLSRIPIVMGIALLITAGLIGAPEAATRELLESYLAHDGTLKSDAPESVHSLLTAIVLDNLPHQYVDDKHWGKTSERWDGLDIRLDGHKIRTKRKKKTVRHGNWRKYEVTLVDPERQFHVRVLNSHVTPDGQWMFDVLIDAELYAFARNSRYVKGAQLYSLSVDADAVVQMRLTCKTAVRLDVSKIPADILLDAEVTDADLELKDFHVRRISKVGGEAAQQVTRSLRSVVERKLDEKEAKIVSKANQQIERHHDRLRLSIQDIVLSKWRKWTGARMTNDEVRNTQ